jgi:hypothetical protein
VPVIVTGALLAESASVVDNKLDVRGGVVDTCRVGPQRVIQATLVALIQPEPYDKAPKIDFRLTDPSGNTRDVELHVPESSLGGEIGFVCYPVQMPVPVDGRYLLSLSGREGVVSLPLNVKS